MCMYSFNTGDCLPSPGIQQSTNLRIAGREWARCQNRQLFWGPLAAAFASLVKFMACLFSRPFAGCRFLAATPPPPHPPEKNKVKIRVAGPEEPNTHASIKGLDDQVKELKETVQDIIEDDSIERKLGWHLQRSMIEEWRDRIVALEGLLSKMKQVFTTLVMVA